MSLILNIETATTVCSVSIFKEDTLLAFRELDNGFTHAENLHLFIKEILGEAKIKISEIDAVAVSKGPGSYTGLRIGVSAAKGIAYALKIPLLSLDTLKIMSVATKEKRPETEYFCPMIDARRMEVYTAVYDKALEEKETTSALIVEEQVLGKFSAYPDICFFGDGMQKCREVLSSLQNVFFLEDIKPSARYMGGLAFEKLKTGKVEDTAYFEPFYLKDFLAGKKKVVK